MNLPFARFEIQGSSMIPTYQAGDRVLVYRWGSIRPGDTVVFCKNGMTLVKRAVKITDDRWVVRGDNPLHSTDSEDFGDVVRDQIIGKVVTKY